MWKELHKIFKDKNLIHELDEIDNLYNVNISESSDTSTDDEIKDIIERLKKLSSKQNKKLQKYNINVSIINTNIKKDDDTINLFLNRKSKK